MKYHYETAVRWYRYQDAADVRVGARPPKGWQASAEIRDTHPITGRPLKSVQWWVREEYAGA
jgi:hypothetical protein